MRLLVGIAFLVYMNTAGAHSGGTDSNGCHTNHATGEYHCHKPKRSAPTTAPLSADKPAAQRSTASPTCYVGPRGGAYTITASGRKNYSGC